MPYTIRLIFRLWQRKSTRRRRLYHELTFPNETLKKQCTSTKSEYTLNYKRGIHSHGPEAGEAPSPTGGSGEDVT